MNYDYAYNYNIRHWKREKNCIQGTFEMGVQKRFFTEITQYFLYFVF